MQAAPDCAMLMSVGTRLCLRQLLDDCFRVRKRSPSEPSDFGGTRGRPSEQANVRTYRKMSLGQASR